ncbi:hypothetical protein GCM10009809_40210 [Isoptericola hypogeus]|uniref:Peptidase S8/S53 domain-containing protein n=1 Tax=Isoptericola hypogeus TaxID=300179 RepID=A0ABN2JWF0_9MICO
MSHVGRRFWAATTGLVLAVLAGVPAQVATAQAATAQGTTAHAGTVAGSSVAVDPPEKIRPGLATTLEAKGKADFWVRLDATADLTPASRIRDWDARGEAVVKALKANADRSQRGLVARLDAAGVDYESFWATNSVYVEDGSAQLARSLAQVSSVSQLWPARTYGELEPVDESADNAPQAVEWGLANINADDVWSELGVDGDEIVIANIDSGVQYDHSALARQYRGANVDGTVSHDYSWLDTSEHCPGNAPCDTNGHGTHTMGTMVGSDGGANQIGVAPGARWITANGCATCSDVDLVEAGQWMLAPTKVDGTAPDSSMRPNIINNSWGSQTPSNDPFLEDLSQAWSAAGIFGVWSNGNNGPACATSGSPGSRTVNYSVGAYDSSNQIAPFSSRGAGQGGAIKPDIAAPGASVRSALPGSAYGIADGTSMAAPHVAGAIALLWSAEPALIGQVEATRQLLDGTAVDAEDLQCGGTADDNNVYGEGRLDALALVRAGDVGPSGVLTGAVTDEVTGDPLAAATVRVVGGGVDTAVDVGPDGAYTVNLPVGDYEATASAFGYVPQTSTIIVTEDATTTRGFALVAAPSSTITGRVTDGSGHDWPLYAKITVADVPDGVFYTEPATGRYRIALPAHASYQLTVEPVYPGYEPVVQTVDLGLDDVARDLAVPVDVEACTAYGYDATYEGTVEDFDAGTLPAGWSVVDHIGTGGVWRFDDVRQRGNHTGGEGAFASIDSDYYDWGNDQDSSLVTPVLDLTGFDTPSIGFHQDYNDYQEEYADVDLSLDGGTTWTTLLHQTADVRGPRLTTIPIPQAANRPNVQVRFHYAEANFDWHWQVDDVYVGNRSCDPVIDGGYIVGTVRDANTDAGLAGARIVVDERTVRSAATPADPGLDDGFYWAFSETVGAQDIAASADSYVTRTQQVDIVDGVTEADLSLAAGQLSVDPNEVGSTLTLGDRTGTDSFTVTNTGTAPATVRFGEGRSGFELQGADGETTSLAQITGAVGAPLQRLDVPVSLAAGGEPTNAPAENGPAAAPWTTVASYPQKIMDNGVVTLDGKIYSLGGGSGSGVTGKMWRYDPATLAWTPAASLPAARNAMTVGVVNGQIVAASGWADGGPSPRTWLYDPGSDAWSTAADNPAPRAAAGQAVLDGRLYAIGGCTSSGCTPTSRTVVAYDPATDTWESLADYPLSVAFASCGALDGQVVCTGGSDGSAATQHTYSYAPDEDAWTRVADAPTDTWAAGYAVANGRLIVAGGVQGGAVTNAVHAYDPASSSWSALPNANTARYRGGAACGFYQVGGASGATNATETSEMLPGFGECTVDASDVEWLKIDRTGMSLEPGDSVTVQVSMRSQVEQPGTYTSSIWIQEDTPYAKPAMPVTMRVTPPSTWGKLAGVVRGVACDGAATSLEGATVAVNSDKSAWTFATGVDGSYAYWMDRRNNPLSVVAAKDGYRSQGAAAALRGKVETTVSFDLEQVGC